MKPHNATLARWVMPAMAVLCLLTQASGFAHLALVQHATCAEHGELLESAHTPTPVTLRRAISDSTVFAAEPDAAPSHAHEHCIVTALRRTPLDLLTKAPALRATFQPGLGGQAPVGVACPPSLALLAVAPKCSPPRA